MTDSQSQPCPPIRSAEAPEGTNAVAAEGGTLKRRGEESCDSQTNKIPRLEKQEIEERQEGRGDSGQLESSTTNVTNRDDPKQSDDTITPTHSVSKTERPEPEDQSDGHADVNQPHNTAVSSQAPDLHRTGAKCVPGCPADPLQPGIGYHNTGVLRVKPGRGEPTLSLSCSDKLARWGRAGVPGCTAVSLPAGGALLQCSSSGEVFLQP